MISQILSFLFGNLDSKDVKRKEELKETALEISRNHYDNIINRKMDMFM